MLPYYGLLTLAVVMFGVQFFFNDKYQRAEGNGAYATFLFTLAGSAVGIVCLAFISGFDFSLTPFALLWSAVVAINNLLFTLCALKALERVNLSMFSLFSMLGGMLLPFLAGLIFYGEDMTVGKGVCIVLITVALAMTVTPKRATTDGAMAEKRELGATVRGAFAGFVSGGGLYYVGVFVLNGMCGVLTKIYEDATLPKVGAATFSLWVAIVSAVISGAALLFLRRSWRRPSLSSLLIGASGGAIEKIANYLLLIALAVLPASVQYPFITGGVMIVSTLFAYLTPAKPKPRELWAIAVSFIGLLALVLIPV